jgi:tryptophan synthase alpha chain
MLRLESLLREARAAGRTALMPFVCAGFPAPGLLPGLLAELQSAGAAAVEIGIPFSDPVADGPVIAGAMHRALDLGCTPDRVFADVRAARDAGVTLGLVAMVSVSIVCRSGGTSGHAFLDRCRDAGFDGLIVPDLPADESDDLAAACRARGLALALLVAPTTAPDRLAIIARRSTGFVYLLARVGITGTSPDGSAAPSGTPVRTIADSIRALTDLPIACGFGVSTPQHAADVAGFADAVIVGSALVERMGHAAAGGESPIAAAGQFTRSLAGALQQRQQR